MKSRMKKVNDCKEEEKTKRKFAYVKRPKNDGYRLARNTVKSSGKRTSSGYRKT